MLSSGSYPGPEPYISDQIFRTSLLRFKILLFQLISQKTITVQLQSFSKRRINLHRSTNYIRTISPYKKIGRFFDSITSPWYDLISDIAICRHLL